MADREAHLVGSLPGATPAAAMATALELLGPSLRSLPDGETGERRNWIISAIEGMRAHPSLELKKGGDWSDYDRIPQFRVRRGHTLYGASLDFGHVAAARESFPAFEQARAAAGRPDLVFQQGVPGDFDMAMFTLGPVGGLRHRRAFTEATLAEIRDARAVTGPDTLFQIEVPAELVLLAKAPPQVRPLLAGLLARTITGLAAGAPAGTHFAVHLCLGDMNNRAFGTMGDTTPLVLLANAVTAGWPQGRSLDLIHAPFAAADHPATTEAALLRAADSAQAACRGALRRRFCPRVPVDRRPAPHPRPDRGAAGPTRRRRRSLWPGASQRGRRPRGPRAHRRALPGLSNGGGEHPDPRRLWRTLRRCSSARPVMAIRGCG